MYPKSEQTDDNQYGGNDAPNQSKLMTSEQVLIINKYDHHSKSPGIAASYIYFYFGLTGGGVLE